MKTPVNIPTIPRLARHSNATTVSSQAALHPIAQQATTALAAGSKPGPSPRPQALSTRGSIVSSSSSSSPTPPSHLCKTSPAKRTSSPLSQSRTIPASTPSTVGSSSRWAASSNPPVPPRSCATSPASRIRTKRNPHPSPSRPPTTSHPSNPTRTTPSSDASHSTKPSSPSARPQPGRPTTTMKMNHS